MIFEHLIVRLMWRIIFKYLLLRSTYINVSFGIFKKIIFNLLIFKELKMKKNLKTNPLV